MQELQGDQQTVEDVVGGEELDVAGSIVQSGVEDVAGVNTTSGKNICRIRKNIWITRYCCGRQSIPCNHPDQSKHREYRITGFAIVRISEHFRELQQRIGQIVEDHHKCPDPGHKYFWTDI